MNMQILIKIDKHLADKLLAITKAGSTQEAVNVVLEKYVKSK